MNQGQRSRFEGQIGDLNATIILAFAFSLGMLCMNLRLDWCVFCSRCSIQLVKTRMRKAYGLMQPSAQVACGNWLSTKSASLIFLIGFLFKEL